MERLFRLIYDAWTEEGMGKKREGAAGYFKYRVSLLEANIDEPSVDASTVIVTGAMQKSSWLHASVYNLHTYLDTRCVCTQSGVYLHPSVCSCRSRTGKLDLDHRSIDRDE